MTTPKSTPSDRHHLVQLFHDLKHAATPTPAGPDSDVPPPTSSNESGKPEESDSGTSETTGVAVDEETKEEVDEDIFSDFWECDICHHILLSKYSLTRHIRNVHTVRCYQCGHCSRTFQSRNDLRTHAAVDHFGERAFECTQCHRQFVKLRSLKQHIKKRHPDTSSIFVRRNGYDAVQERGINRYILVNRQTFWVQYADQLESTE